MTNGRLDVLHANDLAEALFSDVFRDPVRPPNFARFVFLDPRARTFYRDWEKAASDTVAVLRAAAGRDPYDRSPSDLVGQLSTRSDEFRIGWAAHDVAFHRTATKQMHHPLVGDLTLAFEMLESHPIRGCRCSSIPPSPAHRLKRPCASSRAGARRGPSCRQQAQDPRPDQAPNGLEAERVLGSTSVVAAEWCSQHSPDRPSNQKPKVYSCMSGMIGASRL